MRAIIVAPIMCLLVAGAGLAICGLTHWDPHPHELLLAGGAGLIASIAASVPLILARRSDQATAAQAGLIATTVHLLAGIVLAGAALVV